MTRGQDTQYAIPHPVFLFKRTGITELSLDCQFVQVGIPLLLSGIKYLLYIHTLYSPLIEEPSSLSRREVKSSESFALEAFFLDPEKSCQQLSNQER